MIVWLASYPRSGNTALRILLRHGFGQESYSLYDDRHDIGANTETSEVVGHIVHGLSENEFYAKALASSEMVFIKTHDPPLDENKAIYVVRDGRSSIVSYYHYLKKNLDYENTCLNDVIIGMCQYGSWSSHYELWHPRHRKNTLVLRYEDIIGDAATAIDKVAQFTGLRPKNHTLPSFDQLHNQNPSFFRSGDDLKNIAELNGRDLSTFWLLHGHLMINLGYVNLENVISYIHDRDYDLAFFKRAAEERLAVLHEQAATIVSLRETVAQRDAESEAQRNNPLRYAANHLARVVTSGVRAAENRARWLAEGLLCQVFPPPPSPKPPRVTIVTPVLNAVTTLRATIESVLAQEYADLEYIVVDGGSTDGSLDIIEDYRDRIALVLDGPDAGMYDAIGKGFERATGQVLAYLNADDIYEPNAVSRAVAALQRWPRRQVVYFEDQVDVDGWRFPNEAQPNVDFITLVQGHILFQDGVFFTVQAYRAAGGIDRSLRYAGDWDLWTRMSSRYRFRRAAGHVSVFSIRLGQLSENMTAYREEMRVARIKLLSNLHRWQLLAYAPLYAWNRAQAVYTQIYRRVFGGRRLFFPIDSKEMPPPLGRSIAPMQPRTPDFDGSAPIALLFSSRDTRFGDDRINYLYYHEGDRVSVEPALDRPTLKQLYATYYSKATPRIVPPDESAGSPYRDYRGGSWLLRSVARVRLPHIVRALLARWPDRTLEEIQEGLAGLLPEKSTPLRFLDVGCFDGKLLDRLRDLGTFEAHGLEPNASAAQTARNKGHQVWHVEAEDVLDVLPSNERFDVIFIGQTIEHFNDPQAVLVALASLLEPEGILILTTPNLASAQIDYFGPTWAHWHVPYHRHIFSRKSIRRLGEAAQLRLRRCRTYSHPSWTMLSISQNRFGLGGIVPHDVQLPPDDIADAESLVVWSRLLYDWRGRGDYLCAVFDRGFVK